MESQVVLNEELGEIICPECKGEGAILHNKMELMDYTCPKCQGKGKLDWCQQVVGVPAPKYYSFDSSAAMSFGTFAKNVMVESTPSGKNHFHDYYMEMIDDIANKMANDIDKQILRSLEEGLEHNENKPLKIAVDKRRRHGYDYGVFSEFLLFTSAESEVEDKEN